MAGLNDTDIKLNDSWQLTQASTGDAPICSGFECFLQDIRLEAVSQPGELFYDGEWGWGLAGFLQAEDDELTRLEITERVKEKLRRRQEIKPETVTADVSFDHDIIRVTAQFQFASGGVTQKLTIGLSRVNVEVNILD